MTALSTVVSYETATVRRPSAPRFVSVDILRGLAILLMIFSGMIPKALPNWMDHGYQPHYRPDANGVWTSALSDGNAVFDGRWKAMTWVDLVFPMFLFSMGVAIPLAMSRRLERGESKMSLLLTLFARWFMLIFFAVLIYHLSPPSFDAQSENTRRLFAIAATAVAFLFFVRWPSSMPSEMQRAVRWVTAFILVTIMIANAVQCANLAATSGRNGLIFRWSQSDTIILVLAWTYVVAGAAWLALPRWPWARFAVLVPLMLLAHYIAISPKEYPDWLWMGDWPTRATLFTTSRGPWTLASLLQSPAWLVSAPARWGWIVNAGATRPWLLPLVDLSPLYNFTWFKFLWVVVPGTIVGDWLVRRSSDPKVVDPDLQMIQPDVGEFPRRTLLALAVATIVIVCVGLRHYGFKTIGLGGPLRTPYFALWLGVPMTVGVAVFARRRVPIDEWLIRRLAMVGCVFASIGLILACMPYSPAKNGVFEGGISKGPPATLSYYFTCVGLCMQLLAGLISVFDNRERPHDRVGLVEANGQNPLLVYFLEHITVNAIFGLTVFALLGGSRVQSLDDLGRFPDHPWLGAVWGAFKTLLIAAFVWRLTRRKIFWRA